MAPRSSTAVTIEGSNDKRMITGTFAGKFLPTQLIYGGKTTQRIQRLPFQRILAQEPTLVITQTQKNR